MFFKGVFSGPSWLEYGLSYILWYRHKGTRKGRESQGRVRGSGVHGFRAEKFRNFRGLSGWG